MANNGGQYGGGGGSQANGGDGLIVVTYTPVNVATGIGILGALVCVEGSQALQAALGSGFPAGYYSGYPTEPTGYPAMMQPAMAVIREMATDQTRATAGWTKFAANAVTHIDYSHNPKYNVTP